MPGMNSGLNPADPTLVAAFRSALLHQGAIALLVIAFLWLVWASVSFACSAFSACARAPSASGSVVWSICLRLITNSRRLRRLDGGEKADGEFVD